MKNILDITGVSSITTATTIIVLLVGLIPSAATGDWTWFSRSGALFVILGVFLAWKQFSWAQETDVLIPESFERSLALIIDSVKASTLIATDNSNRIKNLEKFVIMEDSDIELQSIIAEADNRQFDSAEISSNTIELVSKLKIFDADLTKLRSEFSSNHSSVKKIKRKTEIAYVVMGTLIWAYGDAPSTILQQCKL